jgi:hypothetical protein
MRIAALTKITAMGNAEIISAMQVELVAAILLLSCSVLAQTHSSKSCGKRMLAVKIPESVLPYDGGKKLYVSLIDGGGVDAIGKGAVARADSSITSLPKERSR